MPTPIKLQVRLANINAPNHGICGGHKTIRALVISTIRLGIEVEGQKPIYEWPLKPSATFSAVQEAIRSVKSPLDRQLFIGDIRYHFQKLRKEKGTIIRGRDYARKVMEYRAERDRRQS